MRSRCVECGENCEDNRITVTHVYHKYLGDHGQLVTDSVVTLCSLEHLRDHVDRELAERAAEESE